MIIIMKYSANWPKMLDEHLQMPTMKSTRRGPRAYIAESIHCILGHRAVVHV